MMSQRQEDDKVTNSGWKASTHFDQKTTNELEACVQTPVILCDLISLIPLKDPKV